MKPTAFTLLEVVIYLGACTVIFLAFFTLFSILQRETLINSQKNEVFVGDCIAMDLMKRDLLSASKLCEHWDEKNIVFKKENLDNDGKQNITCIGWKFSADGSFRIEGNYNFLTKRWAKKVVSRMNFCGCLPKFSFVKNKSGNLINSIRVDYKKNETLFVCLRNGRNV